MKQKGIFQAAFLILMLLLSIPAGAQFMGGLGDGFSFISSGNSTLNAQTVYCSGSLGDGFSVNNALQPLNMQTLYCTGGNQDGFSSHSSSVTTMNTQIFYTMGGVGDGFDADALASSFNQQSIYCAGGSGDGFEEEILLSSLNTQPIYCSGGPDDGFGTVNMSGAMYGISVFTKGSTGDGFAFAGNPVGSLNPQYIYCSGGVNDGFNYSSFSGNTNPTFVFFGGMSDGADYQSTITTDLGNGIWLGVANRNWSNSANWLNGIVPDENTVVFIPAGKNKYPLLNGVLTIGNNTGVYKCARMDVDSGATVKTTNQLVLNGIFNIGGDVAGINSMDTSIKIMDGGVLTIAPTGRLYVGKQTAGAAVSDLVVLNNGQLNLAGGLLHIDDQLNVLSGGNFLMTSGILYVNKAGNGSALSDSSYSPFYISAGATGGISGGTVKIAGMASSGTKHAFVINEPSFKFTGNSNLVVTADAGSNQDDCGIFLANGSQLNNLFIDNPGFNTYINSDLTIVKKLHVLSLSNLIIEPGKQIEVLGN